MVVNDHAHVRDPSLSFLQTYDPHPAHQHHSHHDAVSHSHHTVAEHANPLNPTHVSDSLGEMMIKSFVYIAPIAVVAVIIFEYYHRRHADVDFDLEVERATDQQTINMGKILSGSGRLITPFLYENNRHRKLAWIMLSTIMFLVLAGLYTSYAMNTWQKSFWDSIEHKQRNMFFHLLGQFVAICIVSVLFGVYSSYIRSMFVIRFRTFLTQRFQTMWFQANSFYQVNLDPSNRIDNPDQRIEQDVDMFCGSSLNMFFDAIYHVGQLFVFLPLLIIVSPSHAFGLFYCPGWLALIGLFYAALGTLATHFLGRELILLNYATQRYNADYRLELVRVREHAEAIALYNSHQAENRRLMERFEMVKLVFWETMRVGKNLGFFRAFFGTASGLFPYFVLAPSYFNGDISLGDMFQVMNALGHVMGSFDWLINSYSDIADWRATTDRLVTFEKALQKFQTNDYERKVKINTDNDIHPPSNPNCLEVRNVSISKPDGSALWSGLSMSFPRGKITLISGMEGSGKSVLMKSIAGIWPFSNGGFPKLPDGSFFLPQEPYVPEGTLREALCYPEPPTRYETRELIQALTDVKLQYLIYGKAYDALKTEQEVIRLDDELERKSNWVQTLSQGELQRLAICHALLKKPTWLFMDESTSSLEEASVVEILNLLTFKLPKSSLVIISHDVSMLKPFAHQHYVVARNPDGSPAMELSEISEPVAGITPSMSSEPTANQDTPIEIPIDTPLLSEDRARGSNNNNNVV